VSECLDIKSKTMHSNKVSRLFTDRGPEKGTLEGVIGGEEAEIAPLVCYKGTDRGPEKGTLEGVIGGEEAEAAPLACYKGRTLSQSLEKTIARCGLHVRSKGRRGTSSPRCEKE
jgi:hypothetical protein